MVDDPDKKIIGLLQDDMPMDPRPFAIMADQVGITEEQFLSRVKSMVDSGIIRRFGATLHHQKAGFSANAMVAWIVPDSKVEEAGRIMAGFREVSHCYQRVTQGDWKYNVYTMIHGNSRDECREIARRISKNTGINEYAVLFSEKEFKKTSMEYY
jgi:DNA-binding Lrp family transcriptional regulator